MAVIHVLEDCTLNSRLRRELDENCGSGSGVTRAQSLDPARLPDNPLLCSIYAETLRLHISLFVPVVPLHGELNLKEWNIPKASYGLICGGVSHMNKDVWNNYGGKHPLESFWAERFIVDPADPLSGPISPVSKLRGDPEVRTGADKQLPYFTTAGLEGSWIPFGGM